MKRRAVKPEDIEQAREQGASDEEIHDTVLIAAAFSMFNRYVDGLGTELPKHEGFYEEIGGGKPSSLRLTRHWSSAPCPLGLRSYATA